MTRVLLDEIIHTAYGQFEIIWDESTWDGDPDVAFAGQSNGLVGAASGGNVFLTLGRYGGGFLVRIERSATVPPVDESWEDCVEVSITVPAGRDVQWASWAGESYGKLDLPPDSYRLRVSSRGRDLALNSEFAPEVVDFYLLQLWPEAPSTDAIVRVGSRDAEYFHEAWGNRRQV